MLISQWPASDLNGAILSMLLVRRLDHTNAVETIHDKVLCLYIIKTIRVALGQRIEQMEEDRSR